jgi:Glyoxalase-like domain
VLVLAPWENDRTSPPRHRGLPDPAALAAFYSGLLGLPVTRQEDDFAVVAAGDTTSGIGFQLAPDFQPPRWPDPAWPQQMHFDVMVDDVEAAGPRVLTLGARRLTAVDSQPAVYRRPSRSSVLPDPAPGLGRADGAIISNGNLYCPATPQPLPGLGPLARDATPEETAAHDHQTAETARYKLGKITASAGARTCGLFVGRTDAQAASTVERPDGRPGPHPQEENSHAPARRSVTNGPPPRDLRSAPIAE